MDLAADLAVEAHLRDELAREARAVEAVVPVLRHLLASEAHALVSDAILARVRGMVLDGAAQLLAAKTGHDFASRSPGTYDPAARDALAEALTGDAALLTFCHALATESLIADRLQQRHGIDPVLSPLLQELIASEDSGVATLAMQTLAAQSRFVQGQRRMELPLRELPAELFHDVVAQLGDPVAAGRLQADYDEAGSRLGLMARLVAAMRRGAVAALELEHAGLPLFVSALASAAQQPRVGTVLACHEGQGLRLALMLRAAGLGLPAIERHVQLVGPMAVPAGRLAVLTSEAAAVALLGTRPAA